MGNYDYISKYFGDISGLTTQVSHVNEERNVVVCWILAKPNNIFSVSF